MPVMQHTVQCSASRPLDYLPFGHVLAAACPDVKFTWFEVCMGDLNVVCMGVAGSSY